MERLLVLRLEVAGCRAEAVFNGVPLARVGQEQTVVTLPVHEFTLAGLNELELIINPAPPGQPESSEPAWPDGPACASLWLLLPRIGHPAQPSSARTLAQIEWVCAPDEVQEFPTRLTRTIELPIRFPRWRWLDAPVITDTPTLAADVVSYLRDIAIGLAKGDPEPLIHATRLRMEDLSVAYQRDLAAEVARCRAHIRQLHAEQALKPMLPSVGKLLLRPVAAGRMLECLAPDGSACLKIMRGQGSSISWPLRIAMVEGQFYVLR